MMGEPERKAYFQRVAKEIGLPYAYTTAITDYMSKTQIAHVTVTNKKKIQLFVSKKAFSVESVNIIITEATDQLVEQGAAQLSNQFWVYSSTPA